MKVIETTGTVDERRQLHLDKPLPFSGPSKVRVIILPAEEDDFSEEAWLEAGAANPAFDFVKASGEAIHSISDGAYHAIDPA